MVCSHDVDTEASFVGMSFLVYIYKMGRFNTDLMKTMLMPTKHIIILNNCITVPWS